MTYVYYPVGKPSVKIRPHTRDTVVVEKGGKLCIDIYNMNNDYFTARLFIDGEEYGKVSRLGVKTIETVCFRIDLEPGEYTAEARVTYRGKIYTDTKKLVVVEVPPKFQNVKIWLVKYRVWVEPNIYSELPSTIEARERFGISYANLPTSLTQEEAGRFRVCIYDGEKEDCYTFKGYLGNVIERKIYVGLADAITRSYEVRLYYRDKLLDKQRVSGSVKDVYSKIIPAIKSVDLEPIEFRPESMPPALEYDIIAELAFAPLKDIPRNTVLEFISYACINIACPYLQIQLRQGIDRIEIRRMSEILPNRDMYVLGYMARYTGFPEHRVYSRKIVVRRTDGEYEILEIGYPVASVTLEVLDKRVEMGEEARFRADIELVEAVPKTEANNYRTRIDVYVDDVFVKTIYVEVIPDTTRYAVEFTLPIDKPGERKVYVDVDIVPR